MFIKKTKKTRAGKEYYQHQLMKSVRTPAGPRQEMVLNMKLLDLPKDRWKQLANAIEEKLLNQTGLFVNDEEIEALATHYASLIIANRMNKKAALSDPESTESPDYESVDLNSLKQSNDKSYGGENIIASAFESYKFDSLLEELGFSIKNIAYSKMLIAGRLLHPASERETARWLHENSSFPEFANQTSDINDMGLHRAAYLLYTNRQVIEERLSATAKNIFSLQEKILLYDLTNTYFEGSKRGSSKAKRGFSKEKRTDCPLLTLGLTVDAEGFPKNSNIYAGNVSEPLTFKSVLDQVLKTDDFEDKTLVMDAGIATEENLNLVRSTTYNMKYIAVSRKRSYPVEFWTDSKESSLTLADKKTTLKLKSIRVDGEVFLLCHSEAKEKKEQEIIESRRKKYEDELRALHAGFSKPRTVKKYEKVLEKLGRLKEKYKVGSLYDIQLIEEGKIVTGLTFKRNTKSVERDTQFGNYVLRTNREDLADWEISQIHRSLTLIEDCFRSMKSHLGMRPNHHKEDKYSEAHIFATILAYHFMISIIKKLRAGVPAIKYNWSSIRNILVSHRRVTTTVTSKDNRVIHIRQNGEANIKQKEIYKALKIMPKNGLKRIKIISKKNVVAK